MSIDIAYEEQKKKEEEIVSSVQKLLSIQKRSHQHNWWEHTFLLFHFCLNY